MQGYQPKGTNEGQGIQRLVLRSRPMWFDGQNIIPSGCGDAMQARIIHRVGRAEKEMGSRPQRDAPDGTLLVFSSAPVLGELEDHQPRFICPLAIAVNRGVEAKP